jgi:glycosyltransferase involved in cell wall biosynthesis
VDLNHFRQSKEFRAKRKSYGIKDDEIVGIYAGRWDPVQKRVQFLLDVIRERTDIKWVIATDAKIDISEFDNVVLINGVGYDEMPQIYSMADFALQLSLYEGFSYFAVESIACSLPLISTRVGVADEIYTDSELSKLRVESWHHDPSFMDEVNSKISFLKDNPDFRLFVADRCRGLAEKMFSLETWRKAITEYLGLSKQSH